MASFAGGNFSSGGRGTITVSGRRSLAKKLSRMSKSVRGKIARQSTKKAMKPVLQRSKALLRSNGNVETRALVNSIGTKTITRGGSTMTFVGPRVGPQYWKESPRAGEGPGTPRKPTKYGHFIEFGTRHHKDFPFQRPALWGQQANVEKILGQELGRKITEQATKK